MSRLSSNFDNEAYDYLIDEINFIYERFDDFIAAADTMAKNESERIVEKIDEWNNKYPSHEFSGFENHENEFIRFLSFANHIDSAIMILAYSTFEKSLKMVCTTISKEVKSNLLPDDFAGKGIMQSKKFLEKVLIFDFTEVSKEWELITLYAYLRNKIVHWDSKVSVKAGTSLNDIKEVNSIKKFQLAEISEEGKISLSKENNKNFVRISVGILNSIVENIRDKKGTH